MWGEKTEKQHGEMQKDAESQQQKQDSAEADTFRSECFEKQRKYLSRTLTPVGTFTIAIQFLLWLSGVFDSKMAFLSMGAITSSVLTFHDDPAVQMSVRTKELKCTMGLWTCITLFHIAIALWEPPSVAMKQIFHGHFGVGMKIIYSGLHLSDVHFWIVNLSDSVFWLLSGYFGYVRFAPEGDALRDADGLVFLLAGGVTQTVMAAGVRRLSVLTLWEATEEVIRRRKAEESKDRFLSYIMHEMRNPLSGASLLVYEFQETIKGMLKSARKNTHPNVMRAAIFASAQRLQQLTDFLIPQFDKMKRVCDDVLQLEKLEKGGLEYAFRPVDIRKWMTRVAGQAAPLFKGGVSFSWAIQTDGEKAEELFENRPEGVADFVRLDQVVSNFLSNARKFTRKGEVTLTCSIKLPSDADRIRAPLLSPKQTSPSFPSSSSSSVALNTQTQQWAVGVEVQEVQRGNEEGPIIMSDRSPKENGGGKGKARWCRGRIGVESAGRGEGSTFFFEIFVPLVRASVSEGTGSYLERSQSRGVGESSAKSPQSGFPPAPPSGPPQTCQGRTAVSARRMSSPAAIFAGLRRGSVTDSMNREFVAPSRKFLKSLAQCTTDPIKEETPEEEGGGEEEKKSTQGESEREKIASESVQQQKKRQSESTESALSSLTADVLLVDDDRFCLMAGSAAIRRMGFSVVTAEDGDEAVKMFEETRSSFRLVLIDKNMARLHGPEAVKSIRKHFQQVKERERESSEPPREGGEGNQARGEPIIVGCTGDAVKESSEAFLAAGADRVIMKPLQPKDLADLLGKK
uniref:histidine kinase n=1 Tax=Chromera velia CCMP2878 TaxID=1169474 RepID=A0A0G4HLM6_9ALVE|eukprot:Cvel_28802.t1-p1 / transcript=Cvel_28802.t1 / gene=Cvel_28802 / organism=Chromera_velia_CCMP2878 / gene_product=Autoinducer 2 sensor kinase/phosphatase LuxQ, putative / transcript_product=Autoinducer 2 sensor kinase/phosphatase LuxQ, putative / location=Cvel_scaffold3837:3535-6497(+) / protein_length=797 / sequence_SO=supercontig / SO=protein_coding / is_pseudo=false